MSIYRKIFKIFKVRLKKTILKKEGIIMLKKFNDKI